MFDLIPVDVKSGAKDLSSWLWWAFAITAAASVGVVIAQGARVEKRSAGRRADVSRFGNALGDTFEALKRLIDSGKTESDKRVFFESLLAEVKALMPIDEPRASIYELDASDEQDGIRQLRLLAHRGRVDPPRAVFGADTPYGRDLIAIVEAGRWRCIDDARDRDFEIDVQPETKWRSFMVVPFNGGKNGKSVLLIDTPTRTRFTHDHRTISEAIARLMEIGMARVTDAAEDTQPELNEVARQLAGLGVSISHTAMNAEGGHHGEHS